MSKKSHYTIYVNLKYSEEKRNKYNELISKNILDIEKQKILNDLVKRSYAAETQEKNEDCVVSVEYDEAADSEIREDVFIPLIDKAEKMSIETLQYLSNYLITLFDDSKVGPILEYEEYDEFVYILKKYENTSNYDIVKKYLPYLLKSLNYLTFNKEYIKALDVVLDMYFKEAAFICFSEDLIYDTLFDFNKKKFTLDEIKNKLSEFLKDLFNKENNSNKETEKQLIKIVNKIKLDKLKFDENEIVTLKDEINSIYDSYIEGEDCFLIEGIYLSISNKALSEELKTNYFAFLSANYINLKDFVVDFYNNYDYMLEIESGYLVPEDDFIDDFYVKLLEYSFKNKEEILFFDFSDINIDEIFEDDFDEKTPTGKETIIKTINETLKKYKRNEDYNIIYTLVND